MNEFEQIEKAILLTILFVLLFQCFYHALRSILASRWPKTNGEILSAKIQEDNKHEQTTWIPEVEFKYKVRGKEYYSNNLAFGFRPSFFFLSKWVLKKYENRPCVKVSYNPYRPQQAVLITGLQFFHLYYIGLFGGLLYFFGPELGL